MAVVGAVEALAALLIIALLGGLLASRHVVGPGPNGSPRLDAASQAYLTMLRTYYAPLVDANITAQACVRAVAMSTPDGRPQLIPTCRAPLATELAAARTFSAQLDLATAPTRWQAQHAALKRETSDLISVLATQVVATDAGNIAQLLETIDPASQALKPFRDSITQINIQIHAGQPPLPAPLPVLGLSTYG
jgi:hypothetical protein